MKNQINATTGAKTYNGWTNYETWAVKLWLDNDESDWTLQQELLEQARYAIPPFLICTKEEEIRFKLANLIEEWVKDNSPLADRSYVYRADSASMFSDLLGAAIASVNFTEIAEHIIDDEN